MNAEGAYLFRHALLRDAADAQAFRPHPSDPWARELAWQAAMAGADPGVPPGVVTLYLRRSATLADRGRQPEAALEAWEAFTERATGADRAEGELNAGQAATAMGRNSHAERTYEDALRILREVGDRRFEGIVCSNLARSRFRGGKREEGEALSRRAVLLLRETGDRASCGSALGSLANFCVELGRHADAGRTWLEGLALARETGSRRTEGVILGNLGAFQSERRRFEEAESNLARALEIHRSLGNRAFEGSVLGGLACLRALQHRRPEALSLWAEALASLRAVGRPDILQGLESSMRRVCRDAGLPALDEPGA